MRFLAGRGLLFVYLLKGERGRSCTAGEVGKIWEELRKERAEISSMKRNSIKTFLKS